MPLKVTVNVFSGRENPSFTLSDTNSKKLLDQLSIGKFKKQTAKTNPFPSVLGYSGLIVEQDGKQLTADLPSSFYLAHDNVFTNDTIADADANTDLKALIFDNIDKAKGFDDIKDWKKFLNKSVDDYLDKRKTYVANHFKFFDKTLEAFLGPIKFKACICSPAPDLANWNASFQGTNNCYNYGTNYRTDTFAQPGKASNNQYTSLASCNPAGQVSAKQGAISDGLVDLPNNNNTCPSTGHLAALVNWPNFDFHWYRKGTNGRWSHKPGGTAATILDNSGNPITDPRTADRGGYTNFCSFMQVIHGHFKVK
jgi:hypothetical protein